MYPGILFIRTIVLIMRAPMFLHFGSTCLARTFQSAVQSQEKKQQDIIDESQIEHLQQWTGKHLMWKTTTRVEEARTKRERRVEQVKK